MSTSQSIDIQGKDFYALSPMQQGMLFNGLRADRVGIDLEQMLCTLRENLNLTAFIQAWQRIVDRHAVLRTSFQWESVDEPIQVIHCQVPLPITYQDWQALPKDEQHQRLHTYLLEDRQRGFDLTHVPLMRLAVFQISTAEYWVIWSFHHILLDGRSFPILLKEAFGIYEALCQGQEVHLPPTKPFKTYIEWLQEQTYTHSVGYWQQLLGDFTVPTPLPEMQTGGSNRNTVESAELGEASLSLSAETTTALKTLAQQHQITPNTLVQGAWALLLNAYGNQGDVVFGATRACRRSILEEIEETVGIFINDLPVRVRIAPDMPLIAWLQELRAQHLAVRPHEHTPLVEVQKWSAVPAGTALFDSLVVFENYSLTTELQQQGGNWLNRDFQWFEKPSYPLTLTGNLGPELLLRLLYDRRLFEPSSTQRILKRLQGLLEGFVADPEKCLGDISILTADERHQVLEGWNDTAKDYPHLKCVHHLFEQQVEQTPDLVAVVLPGIVANQPQDQALTYRELNDRANQLAHYLQSLGIGPDVLVAVSLERSLEMTIAILAILKAGGAYVPVDPAYPTERRAFMLEDTKAPVILTQAALAPNLPEHQAKVICLDQDWEIVSQYESSNPASAVTLEHLTYVIYTSGSTGKPKGVMLGHHALANLICWQLENSPLGVGDRTLQFASLSFDVSFQEMFSTWCSGGTLVMVSDSLRRDAFQLLDLINRETIARLFLPFIALQQLAEAADNPDQLPTTLKEVMTAGEQLQISPSIINLFSRVPDCVLYNQYGPSESHVVTAFTLSGSPQNWSLLPPIGRPIANTQIYLLDPELQPVPIGVDGELYIGGVCLARGYLNRPELTAERFIPNPFKPGTNERLYKAGDLARFAPNGEIQYIGRIDNQVKIRGFRIELGEIEATLLTHPALQEAAVIAREDTPGDKRLVAYVVPQSGQTVAPEDLRSFLKQTLLEHMVPAVFATLEKLPLTPSGKIDRRSLPAPTLSQSRAVEVAQPRTPTEEIVTSLWRNLLGVEVGIHDNFFELGGHSLLATRIISRLRETCSVDLSIASIFQQPTPAGFSALIDHLQQQDQREPVPPLQPVTRGETLPLSFAQERLWFLNQLTGDSATYNIPWVLQLEGTLNVAALSQALQAIVDRHESLRTYFQVIDDQPIQVIAPKLAAPLNEIDLQAYPNQAEQVQQSIKQEIRYFFSLEQLPLFRFTLLRLKPDSHLLLIVIHHIISDGWSMDVITYELSMFYQAFLKGEPPALPDLPIQYVDYTFWQRQWLAGAELERQLSYWRQQLAGAPDLMELPTDRPRPAIQTFQGAKELVHLSHELTQGLKSLGQQAGATLFMTLFTGFSILLSRYARQSEVVIGSPIANRFQSELEPLIGFFVNTLALRVNLEGNPSFMDLLSQVQRVALDAYAHQDVPFEKLVQELNPVRHLSHHTLFQVMFVLQNTPNQTFKLPGLTISSLDVDTETAKFDLTLSLTEVNDGLEGSLEYNADLFDRSTIQRLVNHFQNLLTGIVADPKRHVAALPLLSEAEQQQILVDWNATEVDYPKHLRMHDLFEGQVEKTPTAPAVIFNGQTLSYQELNQRANQLAHHLQKMGVKPEVTVGICIERSFEMVVALMAILKAGGAYVPLDPTYPAERLAHILSDAQLAAVLTQDKFRSLVPAQDIPVLCVDTAWDEIATESQENPTSPAIAENLAYIIYTSGSTGKPKGVLIEHQGAVNTILDINKRFRVVPGDRVLAVCSLNFDLSVYDIFGLLAAGGTIVLPQPSVAPDLHDWITLMQQEQVNLWNTAPPVMQMFAGYLVDHNRTLPECLRLVMMSGDWIPLTLPDQIRQLRPGDQPLEIISLGGATEASIWSILYPIEAIDPGWKSIPYGRPMYNQQFYVLNEQLCPVPVGQIGELYIGGDGVARGYHNRPDLNATKFLPDPFRRQPRAQIYRTGDLGRYMPDGTIEFLGRIDHQVKIRGFRIEMGEVEVAVSTYPSVQHVAVIVREDTPGDKRLVAYVVAKPGETIVPEDLTPFVKNILPSHMVPAAFVVLDQLPLTPNGKLDRKALPAPSAASPAEAGSLADRDQPQNEIQRQLVEIWQESLGVQPIGIKDNFFALGGHSLLAVQLWSKVEKTFKRDLPLITLFQAPTIEQLAERFRQPTSAEAVLCPSLVVIQAGDPDLKPPVFCLHVLGRGLKFCRPFLKYLDPKQPVYGLSTQLSGEDFDSEETTALAQHYVQQIRKIQPEGPYLLLGISYGGILAFEVARLLSDQGITTDLLALLDTRTPDSAQLAGKVEKLKQRIQLRKFRPDYVFHKIRRVLTGKAQWLGDWSRDAYFEASIKFCEKFGYPLSVDMQDHLHARCHEQAQSLYQPQFYEGTVTLFKALAEGSGDSSYVKSDLGWGKWSTEVRVHEIPGTHLSMLEEPFVRVLGQQLQRSISKAIATAQAKA